MKKHAADGFPRTYVPLSFRSNFGMENFPAHVQDTGAASESARDELSKAETAYQNVLVIDKQNPELPPKKFPARINLGII